MYRIIRGNCTGKTRELLAEAKRTGGVVACAHPESTRQKAESYGIYGVTTIPYEEVISHYYDVPLYIDELEKFLVYCCNRNFAGYTLTDDR